MTFRGIANGTVNGSGDSGRGLGKRKKMISRTH